MNQYEIDELELGARVALTLNKRRWSPMCMSSHEMSTARIERDIQDIKEMLEDKTIPEHDRHFWEGRLEGLEGVLRDRAEEGTYV
jgi:hypothetical protein